MKKYTVQMTPFHNSRVVSNHNSLQGALRSARENKIGNRVCGCTEIICNTREAEIELRAWEINKYGYSEIEVRKLTDNNITYTNNTNNHQVVGCCQKIFFEGTLAECEAALETLSPIETGYGVIEIFEPGQTGHFRATKTNYVALPEGDIMAAFLQK